MTMPTLAGKTILVSGGSRGTLGFADEFADQGIAAREEDLDLDFFLPDAPLPARA
jgi:hypothetical protein